MPHGLLMALSLAGAVAAAVVATSGAGASAPAAPATAEPGSGTAARAPGTPASLPEAKDGPETSSAPEAANGREAAVGPDHDAGIEKPGSLPNAEDTATTESAIPAALLCRGNEPFWTLRVDGANAQFERLGQPSEMLAGVRAEAAWAQPPFAVWRGRPAQAVADLVAVVTAKSCQDTMADDTDPFSTIVSTAGGEVLAGCCRMGETPESPVTKPVTGPEERRLGWWDSIPTHLNAIEQCFAAAKTARAVAGIRRNTDGESTVRMKGTMNDLIQCRLSPDLQVLEVVSSVDAETWQAGDARVLFTPAPAEPPAGGCYDHNRVVDDSGRLLGWVSRDTC